MCWTIRSWISGTTVLCAVAVSVLGGCAPAGDGGESSSELDPPPIPAPAYSVTLSVEGERDVELVGAEVAVVSVEVAGDKPSVRPVEGETGQFLVDGLRGPEILVAAAEGYLSLPVVVGREDAGEILEVQLLSARGTGSAPRVVLHFAGDVMLGRRYVTPVDDDTARVVPGDGGESARDVVGVVAPLFQLADLRALNLETVVGTLPEDASYPGKRFLLQSPPEAVEALRFLEVDVATLGNNHALDWLEPGLRSTMDRLSEAGLDFVGARLPGTDARFLLCSTMSGVTVGFLSYTSVNGDFVNDSLPLGGEPPPGLPEKDLWQYEKRVFGFLGTITIDREERTIGEAWKVFSDIERKILEAEQSTPAQKEELAEVWAALRTVYPELQDWVARRGHGGALSLDRDRLADDVLALEDSGADLVVVQLHSGFQFLEVKSEFVERAAHAAIDAGAHLVVCHHPHVLQGLEWYKERLIAYSLGNFIFDQDFLATFTSAVLRVVFEEDRVVEARIFPIVLDRYRPAPIAGKSAERVLRSLEERSYEAARSERTAEGVRKVLHPRDDNAEVPRIVREGSSGRVDQAPLATHAVEVFPGPGRIADLSPDELTRSRGPGGVALPGILFGRDLFGWGSFEDATADGVSRGGHHWVTNDTYKRVDVLGDAPDGVRALRLRRTSRNQSRVLARPRARVTFSEHRVFREVDGVLSPADGPPRYSARLRARLEGEGAPLLRVDVYRFDDSDPNRDPESVRLASQEFDLPVEPDGPWSELEVALPEDLTAGEANAAMLYVGLAPPGSGTSVLWVDGVQFLEWRGASDLPDSLYGFDAVRYTDDREWSSVVLERTR